MERRQQAGPMHMGASLGKCSRCPRSYDVAQMTRRDGRYVCPACVEAEKNAPPQKVNAWTETEVHPTKPEDV